ncbi:MAG: hypothetical protein HND44_00740 [Chloroflexi bacterium]|nr:hypothetical protein [Ardenticatenaceae bacterium]MBL1127028.1 hypothetical protein [Chloroflexota bacterium]NOG33088.1 hypothetical protein [Chloroflexota bacterium]GIK54614.1 MAG: hypothetical protein BroJett015_02770 [Chloroflexota bacterium]
MQLLSGATLGLMPVYTDRNEGNDYLWAAIDPPAQGATYQFDKWVATVDVGVRQFKFRPSISGGQGCANAADGIRRVHIIEHPCKTMPCKVMWIAVSSTWYGMAAATPST